MKETYILQAFTNVMGEIKDLTVMVEGIQKDVNKLVRDGKNDLVGETFNNLTVISQGKYLTSKNGKRRRRTWNCVCVCGKECNGILPFNLKGGNTKSCGCLKTKHGHTKNYSASRTHKSWSNMIQRVTNPNRDNWNNYGGRGITVCDRWRNSFANFLEDMGEKPEGLTLERINNDGNYEPDNCKWATMKEQGNNRRNSLKNKLSKQELNSFFKGK